MKYSVIIPTMWVPNTFKQELIYLITHQLVAEIIIINNRIEATPIDDILHHPKIRMINQESNIYVNPAWNLGVSLATNEFICLLNDDILFDTSVFDFLSDKITKDIGIIGLNMMDHIHSESHIHLSSTTQRCWGFGCMMFFHKNSYVNIPDQLKILYGDDFLFYNNISRGNYLINGLHNNQAVSATCCSDLNTKNPKLPEITKIENEWWINYEHNIFYRN